MTANHPDERSEEATEIERAGEEGGRLVSALRERASINQLWVPLRELYSETADFIEASLAREREWEEEAHDNYATATRLQNRAERAEGRALKAEERSKALERALMAHMEQHDTGFCRCDGCKLGRSALQRETASD